MSFSPKLNIPRKYIVDNVLDKEAITDDKLFPQNLFTFISNFDYMDDLVKNARLEEDEE